MQVQQIIKRIGKFYSQTPAISLQIFTAQGLVGMLQDDYQVKIVSTDDLIDNINENVAAVFFTEVDYKTGRRYDAKKIIKAAKQNGSLVILDLAHSAGAIDTI